MSASAVLEGAAALASIASNYATQTRNMKNQLDINNKNIGMQLAYNADQVAVAQMNNQTQIDLANTAHQREVMDLRDAGLNPILSATGGNGAAMPSLSGANGSAGHADAYAADDPLKELGVSARELGRYISESYNAQVEQAKIENDIQKEVLKSLKVEGALDRTKMLSEISAYDTMRHKVYDANGNEVLMMRDDGAIVLNSDYIADLAAAIKADLHNAKWNDVRTWMRDITSSVGSVAGAISSGAGAYSAVKGTSQIPSRIQLNEAMTRKLNRSK